ncbi:hypothetical protein PR202_gb05589 [Eleusine coracana subsp. coracana]|uniref:Uncharacterized protein n=1 Tax=Eleusine coracana subsp. coracana TaxID=191504 RepID=A0AAV5E7C0_ELECO|nr:hypothetical protein PR202_gb05589 [Eleusine coracana subsp. coracana]
MEEEARAAKALALVEIKALLSNESSSKSNGASDGVTLSIEEYFNLLSKSHEADEISRKKEEVAMLQVETANISAKKMKEVARAAEALTLAEIKVLLKAKIRLQNCAVEHSDLVIFTGVEFFFCSLYPHHHWRREGGIQRLPSAAVAISPPINRSSGSWNEGPDSSRGHHLPENCDLDAIVATSLQAGVCNLAVSLNP